MEEALAVRTYLKKRLQIYSLGLFLVGVFIFWCLPSLAQAATLYFAPSSGGAAIGSSFSVGVYASSPDQAVNAMAGYISFPADKLSVTSVSKSGSAVTLWVQEPTYSNTSGTVSFEGLIPNPGYTGSAAKLITITFQARTTGTAALSFSSGSILANDGSGTNVLTGLGTGTWTLGDAAEEDDGPVPVPATGVPAAPGISSSSHPDPAAWYADGNPFFSWSLPSGTTGVNVLANQEPNADPGTRSDGVFRSYNYTEVEDGIWYFHARLQNEKGWGGITHFRFQIDTVAPDPFTISLLDGEVTGRPDPRVSFFASDVLSGLDHYRLSINGEEIATVPAAEILADTEYVLPKLVPGEKTFMIEAVDKAGNITTSTTTFTLEARGLSVPQSSTWLAGLSQAVDTGVALLLLAILGVAAIMATVFGLRHMHFHWRRHLQGGHDGSRYLHRRLAKLRRGVGRDLASLERSRRKKYLPERSERIIRGYTRALEELESKLEKSLKDLRE
jgi:hypothetical protein